MAVPANEGLFKDAGPWETPTIPYISFTPQEAQRRRAEDQRAKALELAVAFVQGQECSMRDILDIVQEFFDYIVGQPAAAFKTQSSVPSDDEEIPF